MNRNRATAAAIAVLALAAAMLAMTNLAGAASKGTITGAGSTFVQPLVTTWTQHYSASTIAYSGIGSGGGIAAVTARTVDFGASDAPLTQDQFTACKGCVQIPWAFSATSIPYNVSGVSYGLKLTGPVLAAIYGGSVKFWDNPAIAKLNSGVNLPHEKITPVYRSDASGTSYNFTDFLSHVSPAWKNSIGRGTQPNFPVGVGARGSSGVAAKIGSTPGGIGYVDVAYALNNKLKIAKVRNRAGNFELPGLRQIRAAAASLKRLQSKDNSVTVVNPNARAKFAYPICTFTYVIVPLKSGKASEMKKFFDWALTKGQVYGPKLRFVELPKIVQQASRKTVARLHT
ncbi:MAG TPA: phosphate ABC transporter substrate-binding protein PstS [Gaiellaceae bacterium]|nr:phosphate ABC transporter substrate-binding protein PstS [Gaiellaceae bacterium]